MRISKTQIANALGIASDEPAAGIATALRNIETLLDSVAEDLENDFNSAALGDASNLIQVIREGLSNASTDCT
jgi:hypothetical protein